MAVSQNTRRALEAIKALDRLSAGLKKEPATDKSVAKLRKAIDNTVSALESYVQNKSKAGSLGSKSALSQESRQRSMGQKRRQARIDRCD